MTVPVGKSSILRRRSGSREQANAGGAEFAPAGPRAFSPAGWLLPWALVGALLALRPELNPPAIPCWALTLLLALATWRARGAIGDLCAGLLLALVIVCLHGPAAPLGRTSPPALEKSGRSLFLVPLRCELRAEGGRNWVAEAWRRNGPGTWSRLPGKLRLRQGEDGDELCPGGLYACRDSYEDSGDEVPWRAPGPPANPGAPDWRRIHQGQGLLGSLSSEAAGGLEYCGSSRLSPDLAMGLGFEKLREWLGRRIERGLRPGTASFLKAVLLGRRGGLEQDRREDYRHSGLAHLLAVSGLHVGLLALCFELLLALSPLPVKVRGLLLLLILWAYVPLCGARPSVLRAVGMASLLLAGRILERPQDAEQALLLSAVCALLVHPATLQSAGFQLSYLAVFGLLRMGPIFQRLLPEKERIRAGRRSSGTPASSPRAALGRVLQRICRWALSSLAASLAVSLATAAPLLYHFGRLPPAGILLNLGAIPLTAALLVTGLLHLCLPLPGEPAAALLELLLSWLDTLARWGAGSTAPVLHWKPAPLQALLLGAGLLLPALQGILRMRLRMVSALALLLTAADLGPRLSASRCTELVFFDVGQGDATLIRSPGGARILVDAGYRRPGGGWDAGKQRLLPALATLAPEGLDWLVLTHPDQDHIGGAEVLLRTLPVDSVLTNGEWRDTGSCRRIRALLRERSIPVREAVPGMVLLKEPGACLRVLGPPPRGICRPGNDRSVVLRLECPAGCVLMTGDAGEREEVWLEGWGGWLRARVLKLGHHGSKTSSGASFLDLVGAGLGLVSCGRDNHFGHPAEEVLDRCEQRGMEVLRTDREGAVWLELRREGLSIRDWRRVIPWTFPGGIRRRR